MSTYSLSPTGFGKVKSRVAITFVILYPFALSVALIAAYRTNPQTPWWLVMVLAFVIAGALTIGARRGLKMQQEGWLSYKLTIDNNSVSRIQSRVPPIDIPRENITDIIENAHGLTVKSHDKRKFIIVPSSLINYDAAKLELHSLKPVSMGAK